MNDQLTSAPRWWSPPFSAVALVLALALAPGARAAAQEQAGQRTATAARDELGLGTPRKTMTGYLEACRANDFERAARYLDLQNAPGLDPGEGPDLARKLYEVLDQTLWVALEDLSDQPSGDVEDGLPEGTDLVGKIPTEQGGVDVLVERKADPGGGQVWKVSARTVAEIPMLFEAFDRGPLEEYLPPILLEVRFLEILLWQWIGLLVLVVLAWIAAWIAASALVRVIKPLTRRSRTDIDDRLVDLLVGPLRLMAAIAFFAVGVAALRLSVPAREFFGTTEMLLAVLAVTWLIWRVIDLFAKSTQERLRAGGRIAAANLLPLGSKTLKLAIAAMALLAALDSIGFEVTAVIAGLGVGGLAVALAAQNTLENVFGGIAVLLDQPVRPGDFCRFGDNKVGTVEEIGLRSTRIRTLDRTVVSVPNADFSTMPLENFARRDRFWFQAVLGLRYETSPDQLRSVLLKVRELLHAHPKVIPEPARARFVGFGAYSLDVEIFTYVSAVDINEFLAIREDILLRIMDTVASSGSGFAFPSQTTYFARDTGLDEERTTAAETEIAELRAQNRLMFPDFTPERVAEIDGKVAYPPEGSPLRA